MNDLVYRATSVSAGGTTNHDANPYSMPEEAMESLCRGLSRGYIKDGWVENSNGKRVADFGAIKDHCARRTISN